jgi:putative lipoic acid-binding regulatory protein
MDKKTPENRETLLVFPCDFTIKVFGKGSEEFEAAVLMIIHKHVPNLSGRAIQTRNSETGKYTALSITVHVDSKEQLDNIYYELSSSPHVIMAL